MKPDLNICLASKGRIMTIHLSVRIVTYRRCDKVKNKVPPPKVGPLSLQVSCTIGLLIVEYVIHTVAN
jgi:hypothetical protein